MGNARRCTACPRLGIDGALALTNQRASRGLKTRNDPSILRVQCFKSHAAGIQHVSHGGNTCNFRFSALQGIAELFNFREREVSAPGLSQRSHPERCRAQIQSIQLPFKYATRRATGKHRVELTNRADHGRHIASSHGYREAILPIHQLKQLSSGAVHNEAGCHQTFKCSTRKIDLGSFIARELGYDRASIRNQGYQPLRLKRPQRLPHGRATHIETLAKPALGQASAWHESAGSEIVLNCLDDQLSPGKRARRLTLNHALSLTP
ncbi:hypothetical protein GCM10009805_23510 [Leucobacter chromiireducens subsp. solipictus]